MGRTILVTGGAGYVGSHTCKALAAAGYTPIAYDDLSAGHRWAVKWGPLEEGTLLDRGRLEAVLARHAPVAVLHFAAKAYVGESLEQPLAYYENNVTGTIALLEAMRSWQDSVPLVFSSSCAVYGVAAESPISEQHPKNPINPYGASKHFVERILQDADVAYGARSVSLRYFNAAGADPQGEIGEEHDPEPHLIPLVLDAAMGRRDSFTIHGDDYDTPDGTCIRDFIHVADLADAHVRALGYLLGGGATMAVNLGTGTGVSVREVIEAGRRQTGRAIVETVGPRRPGDPARLVADARKAEQVLGWRPRRSDLGTIMTDAWNWHVGHFGVPAMRATAKP